MLPGLDELFPYGFNSLHYPDIFEHKNAFEIETSGKREKTEQSFWTKPGDANATKK